MIVYPAIDIRGGQAVRLIEGDYAQETVYDADPVDAARRWHAGGAEWIHIVDLDGARDGTRANADVIACIRRSVPVNIELGGGLRSLEDLQDVAALGVNRLIIGSAAVKNPDLVREAVDLLGDRVAVGLDARDGKLAAHGWIEQTDLDAIEAGKRFADMGVSHMIFTDIRRDGKLMGPNITALEAMIGAVPAKIIASGGIGTSDDVRAVRDAGAAGVIIGAALYRTTLKLEEALRIAREDV